MKYFQEFLTYLNLKVLNIDERMFTVEGQLILFIHFINILIIITLLRDYIDIIKSKLKLILKV